MAHDGSERVVGTAVVVVIVGLLGAGSALVGAHGNEVSVGPQVVADGNLVVESAFLTEDGHVVVHRDDGGEPGAAIGSVSVESGHHGNLRIDIGSLSGEPDTLWVVLHKDDGDGVFEEGDDPPIETFGSIAGTRVAVESGGQPVHVTSPGEAAQSVADGSVRVSRVAAAEDGHLVLRAVGGDGPGPVVGSTAVSAGRSQNVTVPIDDGFVADQRQYFGVYAVLHRDDGDGVFEEGEDPPVTVGGETVQTRVGLRKGNDSVQVNTGATDEEGPTGPLALPGFGLGALLTTAVVLLVVAVGARAGSLWSSKNGSGSRED